MPTVGRGHVDLDKGVFYRRAIGRRKTKKRQPPVKLPPRLLAHMRRWVDRGIARKAVVEWNGKPVESVRKAFEAAARAAGLDGVTPHILRHTCATWLMQSGVDLWHAAGFLGMTVQQLEAGYGHHHPDYQEEAVAALGGQYAARNPVNKARQTTANVTKTVDFSRRGQ
jgi:integrase